MAKRLKGFKILLWKAYFDKGWGFLSQAKYFLILGGVTEGFVRNSVAITFFAGIVYCIFCFWLGRLFYNHRWIDTEMEISNMFNPFAREVRRKLK